MKNIISDLIRSYVLGNMTLDQCVDAIIKLYSEQLLYLVIAMAIFWCVTMVIIFL